MKILYQLTLAFILGLGFQVNAFSQDIYDFTSGVIDSSVQLSGTEVGSAGITLSSTSTSGTIEIPVSNIAGRQIQLDLDRVNLITDGSFDTSSGKLQAMPMVGGSWFGISGSATNCTSYPSYCASSTTPVANTWFVQDYTKQDALETMGRRKISYGKGTAQIIPMYYPGENYYFSFDVNTVYLYRNDAQRPDTQEGLDIKVSFLDSTYKALAFFNPIPNGTSTTVQGGTTSTYQTMATLRFEDSLIQQKVDPTLTNDNAFLTKTFRLKNLDCQNHMMYGGDIVTSSQIEINHCTADGSTSGSVLFTEADIKYMLIDFASTFDASSKCGTSVGPEFSEGNCSGTLIDNVKLDPIEQVKMEVMDGSGAVLSYSDGSPIMSYQDKGFYIDSSRIDASTLAAIAKVRITLRGYGNLKPTLKKMYLTSGVDITVSTQSSTPTMTRSKPTFTMMNGNYAPYPEYDLRGDFAQDDLRTKCESVELSSTQNDPSVRSDDGTCIATMVNHGMKNVTGNFSPRNMPIRWDSTLNDYIVGWKEGEIVGLTPVSWSNQQVFAGNLMRLKEILEAGFSISASIGALTHETSYNEDIVLIGDSTTFDKVCPFSSSGTAYDIAFATATESQKKCCFSIDSTGNPTGYNAWSNTLCPLGVLQDFSSTTTRSGYEQALHVIKLYNHSLYDIYDGQHTLELNNGSVTDSITIPRVDHFMIAGEVNDNHLSISSCETVLYWMFNTGDPALQLCRSKTKKSEVCTTSPEKCVAVTEFWNDIAADLKNYDGGRRNISIELPQSNKRYNNPAVLMDFGWLEEIGAELDVSNFFELNSSAYHLASSTVVSGFWQPESLYLQYQALRNVAQKTFADSTSIIIDFNDVRASNSWFFDPGCKSFLDLCNTSETSLIDVSPTLSCDTATSSQDDSYYAGESCAEWTPTDAAACRTASNTAYNHYGRGWGYEAGQKTLTRLSLIGLSLPTSKLVYQGNVFSNYAGDISTENSAGNVCWQTLPDANAAIFYRSSTKNNNDIYSQDPLAADSIFDAMIAGDNTASIGIQILNYYLGSSNPFDTQVAVNESIWQSNGENYYAALFQDSNDATTYYLALWWVPQYIYGYQIFSLHDLSGRYDNMFQLLSPYIEEGYIEKRLVNAVLPIAPASATLIPLEGNAASEVTIDSNTLKSLPIGEMPILVKIKTGSSVVETVPVTGTNPVGTSNIVEVTHVPEEENEWSAGGFGGSGCSLLFVNQSSFVMGSEINIITVLIAGFIARYLRRLKS